MKSFKNIFAWVIPLSFILGTWWGFRLVSTKAVPVDANLTALAYEGTIPKETIQALIQRKKLRIEFDWVKNPDEWFDKITSDSKNYDLVFSYHFQAELLAAQRQLVLLEKYQLQNLNRISIDFLRMPFNNSGRYAIPINWGALGFAYNSNNIDEEQLSWPQLWSMKEDQKVALRPSLYDYLAKSWSELQIKEKKKKRRRRRRKQETTTPAFVSTTPFKDLLAGRAWVSYVNQAEFSKLKDRKGLKFSFANDQIPFWVYAVSVSKKSNNKLAAVQAIDHLLSDDVARISILKGIQASTHKIAEKLNGNEELKPSHFRKLKLTQLRPAESYWLF